MESNNPGSHGQNIRTAEDATFVFNKVRAYFDFESACHHKCWLNASTWKTVANLYQRNNDEFKIANA